MTKTTLEKVLRAVDQNDPEQLQVIMDELNLGGFRGVPKKGQRVLQFAIIERYPHFVSNPPAQGTISNVDWEGERLSLIDVRMDDHIPGAEEWDNEIEFSSNSDSISEFFFSFAKLGR